MSYTYTWSDADQTSLKREDSNGNVAFVPTDPANRDYAAFLSSGATAADYVEPPVVADTRTSAEKLEQVTGMTIAEILEALDLS